jgi:hypothetical protein
MPFLPPQPFKHISAMLQLIHGLAFFWFDDLLRWLFESPARRFGK